MKCTIDALPFVIIAVLLSFVIASFVLITNGEHSIETGKIVATKYDAKFFFACVSLDDDFVSIRLTPSQYSECKEGDIVKLNVVREVLSHSVINASVQ